MPGLPDTGDRVADARELGRGLMRGNRAELHLGYDWKNALLAVRERYELEDDEAMLVGMYLRGFAVGIGGVAEAAAEAQQALAEGMHDGGAEPRHLVYPATSS